MTALSFLLPVLLLALAGFLAARQRHRDPPRYWTPRSLDPSWLTVRSAMRGEYGSDGRVVHQTPEHDAVPLVTPCCSVPLAELPPGDHISHDSLEVTCHRSGGES